MIAMTPFHMIEDADGAASLLNPLRRKILSELGEPDSAAGLARRFGMPRQQVNYHLRQLEAAGLVEAVGERKKRNCTERLMQAVARSYLISPAAVGDLALDPARVADQASSAYLVAVAAQMIREVATLRDRAEDADRKLPTLTMQADVRFGSQEKQRAFAEELQQEVARLVSKYHDDETPGGRTFRMVAGAYPAPVNPDEHHQPQETP
jgi:DNA-binding transcriptional ArsR family regulator